MSANYDCWVNVLFSNDGHKVINARIQEADNSDLLICLQNKMFSAKNPKDGDGKDYRAAIHLSKSIVFLLGCSMKRKNKNASRQLAKQAAESIRKRKRAKGHGLLGDAGIGC